MQKNVASQKLMVFAFDSTTNLPKTGDAANITAYESLDYGAVTVLGDTSATEMDATNAKGYYLFDLTQGETNANTIMFSAKSSTANIVVVGAPAVIQTVPAAFTLAGGASGGFLISGSNSGTTTLGALTVTGATTLTGAVALQSTLGVTGAVTLSSTLGVGAVTFTGFTAGAVSATTITASGAVAFQSTLAVTGATTFTGAITGTNASNDLRINGAVPGAAGGLFIAGTNAATVVTTSLTTTFTGNLSGSVNSVATPVAITSNIKKNQALAKFEFLMTDSTNHNPATGLTVTVTRSIDNGAFGAGTLSAVTEIANGIYSVDFAAGDLNGNVITLQATAAASDTTFERIVTQP